MAKSLEPLLMWPCLRCSTLSPLPWSNPMALLRRTTRLLTPAAVAALPLVLVAVLVCSVLLMTILSWGAIPKALTFQLFLSAADNATAARHLLALSRRPHLAGTPANSDAAGYVLSALAGAGLRTHSAFYDALLSYPVRRSLALSEAAGGPAEAFGLVQEASPGDPSAAAAAEAVPTFLAYSPSGAAAGPAAYANYGREEDFAALRAMGVDVTGAVVLARYGKIFRGDIVRNAERAGAAAAVLYTDFEDFGGGGAGGGWFPAGPGMPPTGVQVGTTLLHPGDPTTPGWASVAGGECERLDAAEVAAGGAVLGIPALPVSGRDGEAILKTLGGQVAPNDWQGGERAPLYHLGPGPGFLNLTYTGNETLARIQNVFAVIEGEKEPDRYVLLGNHRDAWTFGAADPSSGTAALLELAERLGKLQTKGWRPRRTIVLCNWDAEEYGLIGSTEWVEENREMLASRAVAYLNVDAAVFGPGFHVSATPQLDEVLRQASKQVQDPDNSSQTLYDSWIQSNGSKIGRLGGRGSDYAAFVQHIGIPSASLNFGGEFPVYHSLYDDFLWMQKFGDPLFHRHVAVASFWGLAAMMLADEVILPFDYVSYASELQRGSKMLEDELLGMPVSISPLYKSIRELKKAAEKINYEKKSLESRARVYWTELELRELNDRLMMAERAFTNREGLLGRPWYKHLIYGPSGNNDYDTDSFPGIADAIKQAKSSNTSDSWHLVQHEVWRAARAVTQASLVLNGQISVIAGATPSS